MIPSKIDIPLRLHNKNYLYCYIIPFMQDANFNPCGTLFTAICYGMCRLGFK